jgi:hypothetical protein
VSAPRMSRSPRPTAWPSRSRSSRSSAPTPTSTARRRPARSRQGAEGARSRSSPASTAASPPEGRDRSTSPQGRATCTSSTADRRAPRRLTTTGPPPRTHTDSAARPRRAALRRCRPRRPAYLPCDLRSRPTRGPTGGVALDITAARPIPRCSTCPWRCPLEDWPADRLAALPRGISRHVVRFVKLSGRILAVKEIKAEFAMASTTCSATSAGSGSRASSRSPSSPGATMTAEPLDACLVTRHLQFSLPYRALYSQALRPDTAARLIDALAVLLVGSTSPGSGGGTSRCPTRSSCATRGRSRHTSSMPRPASCAPALRRAARARSRHRPGQYCRRTHRPQAGGLLDGEDPIETSSASSTATASCGLS